MREQTDKEKLIEAISKLLERGTAKQLSIVWYFSKEVIKKK